MRSLLALLVLSGPALAETPPMSAEAFEAYTTGKTMTYAMAGEVFGTEQYLPGRRVRWAFTHDICKIGHWYPQDELICFVYEAEAEPQCWAFWAEAGGLRARFNDDPEGTELSEVRQTTEPMHCAGPAVGV